MVRIVLYLTVMVVRILLEIKTRSLKLQHVGCARCKFILKIERVHRLLRVLRVKHYLHRLNALLRRLYIASLMTTTLPIIVLIDELRAFIDERVAVLIQ